MPTHNRITNKTKKKLLKASATTTINCNGNDEQLPLNGKVTSKQIIEPNNIKLFSLLYYCSIIFIPLWEFPKS